jgi:hypothetical protein
VPHVLVIGLPKGASQLVDSFAKGVGLRLSRVYAQLGNQGSFVLLPRPEHCLPEIRRYFDANSAGEPDYAGSHVLVLPYADVPKDCFVELEVAESMGAHVAHPSHGQDSTWPKLSRRKVSDHEFHVALTKRIQEHFAPLVQEQHKFPSEFIKELSQVSPQLLIADNALKECDNVALHRYDFICKAVTALTSAVTAGLTSRFAEYCASQGLHHAQSGGSKFTLRIHGSAVKQADIVSQTHLKQGDKTTKEAAARVYYTFLVVTDVRYVALLYAGPHPDGDQSCKIQIPS